MPPRSTKPIKAKTTANKASRPTGIAKAIDTLQTPKTTDAPSLPRTETNTVARQPALRPQPKQKKQTRASAATHATFTSGGQRAFRVQVICDTALEYFRNAILGVRQYSFANSHFQLGDRWLPSADGKLAKMVRSDGIDGIIAQVHNKTFENQLLQLGIPCINISNSLPTQRLPLISQDDRGAGRLAAEHLVRCGCATFGFWGHKNTRYSIDREAGMRAALAEHAPHAAFFSRASVAPLAEGSTRLIRDMAKWLATLPKPVGIFTVIDHFGLHLLRAVRLLGLRVPEDIAILAAGDDEFWAGYESIPLSSIRLPSRQIGFEAARQLDRILNEQNTPAGAVWNAANTRKKTACDNQVRCPPPLTDVRLPVSEIAARKSTDVLFTPDQAVQRAVAFIRADTSGQIQVGDVVRASGVSRSGLQVRFRKALGHSILEEIHRNRVARVQTLLRTTDMKLTQIAELCGFCDSPRLNVLFRRYTGQTPRRYRAQFRHVATTGGHSR